jgi:DNA adenine methylase
MNHLVPWMGGKRRLADMLLRRFPPHECYVEVFAGGAAVFFARRPADVEVLNDINGDLINLYRVVTYHFDEFARQFRWSLTSRHVFSWMQATRPETLTDVQRAARFFYLQHQCFGGKVTGQNFGTATTHPAINLLRIKESLSAAHQRLAGGVYIEQLEWADCIERYDRPHTLFYLDPPYWQTEGYGVPFPWSEYERMAGMLREIKGKAILSINDHPAIRECFAGYDMEALKINYAVGGGVNQGGESGELVIYSWDRQAEPAGLF